MCYRIRARQGRHPCKFAVSSTENGSIYPMEYLICLEGQTNKRTKTCKPTCIARKAT